ncbi:hypothetical protein [Algoriphagus boritolerans]|uniref:Uncharacterized protein n=1 Tax=Algoriphagus boritolerans DSM 17298 = JCM 18970 TaxID=1120964 RepID=A0A1H6AGL0_9BACT|nr:hypothetical protein [Algoriphagus boritolerans]SEG47641.1 hypothetical protein SAMN03080598_04122 [Algoriphagus boritolerans DSM 17298 = JCM 18970]
MENKISIVIPEEVLNEIRECLTRARTLMAPYAQSLTPKQRQKLPKMSDGTEAFVMKSLEFMGSDPQFNPPYIDVAELKKDLDAYFQLKPFDTLAKQLSDEFSDTVMLAGSEAYSVALVYYNTVKMGARMNVPGAKAIYEELRKRFESNGSRDSRTEE